MLCGDTLALCEQCDVFTTPARSPLLFCRRDLPREQMRVLGGGGGVQGNRRCHDVAERGEERPWRWRVGGSRPKCQFRQSGVESCVGTVRDFSFCVGFLDFDGKIGGKQLAGGGVAPDKSFGVMDMC